MFFSICLTPELLWNLDIKVAAVFNFDYIEDRRI